MQQPENRQRRRLAIRLMTLALAVGTLGLLARPAGAAGEKWLTFEGGEGPGKGKSIVFVSGDEEYRSEEGLPQLAKILARRHGFTCTVLFALADDGTIDPNRGDNIPGLEALDKADLVVMLLRFRHLPADQMKHVADYVESGKPIIGLRTSTHAFDIKSGGPFASYSWSIKDGENEGGFGRRVLGETWISHHGDHGSQSTRGIIAPGAENSPILTGIKDGDIWGPTDVYGVRLPLPGDSRPLVLGQVLDGMTPDAKAAPGPKNDPMMPVAWTRTFKTKSGADARVFASTMGASQDLQSEGLRRLFVQAAYWAMGLEDQIPSGGANVEMVGPFEPHAFGFNKFIKGKTPEDYAKMD